jgi:hypothetical protein
MTSTHLLFHRTNRSVESFERKLEEAQKALNIDPRDYVPVLYIDETDHARELLRILPAMALLGRCLVLMLMLMHLHVLYAALLFNHYAH